MKYLNSVLVHFFIILSISALKGEKYENSLSFSSQESMANFFALNYEVDSIIGSVTISNSDNITSLKPLKNIKFISQNLTISRCPLLETLDGLNEKLIVGYSVTLEELHLLYSVELISSTKINYLTIRDCTSLSMENLVQSNEGLERLSISGHRGLDLDFLNFYPKLKILNISNSSKLININGINNLHDLESLRFSNNPNVAECKIDSLCSKVMDGLVVYAYANDNSCDSLKLTANECEIIKYECHYPTLYLLSQDRINDLILNGCDHLENIEEIVVSSLYSDDPPKSLIGLPIFPSLKHLYITDNTALNNISGVNSLIGIEHLEIRNNNSLDSLSLDLNFSDENISINIEDNDSLNYLGKLDGLNSLELLSIRRNNKDLALEEGFFEIAEIDKLFLEDIKIQWEDINEITVNNTLNLSNMDKITAIDFKNTNYHLEQLILNGLSNLETVENISLNQDSKIAFSSCGIENISFADQTIETISQIFMRDLLIKTFVFPKMDYIDYISIDNCAQLEEIDIFTNIHSVGQLNIYENHSLKNLGKLINQDRKVESVYVQNNLKLNDIKVFDSKIDITSNCRIENNPSLNSCLVNSFCRLALQNNNIALSGNGGECNTSYLEENCDQDFSFPELSKESITVERQSLLNFWKSNYELIDSVYNNLTIVITNNDDAITDLSFFDSLKYVGNKLFIKRQYSTSGDSIDLSTFNNCDYKSIALKKLKFKSLPSIASNSRLENIQISSCNFDGEFYSYNTIDSLQELFLYLNNFSAPAAGLDSLRIVDEFYFNNYSSAIGEFCSNLEQATTFSVSGMSTGDLYKFNELSIKESLKIDDTQNLGLDNFTMKLAPQTEIEFSKIENFSASFFKTTNPLSKVTISKVYGDVDLDNLGHIQIKDLLISDITDLTSLELEAQKYNSVNIENCDSLQIINLSKVENIEELQLTNCSQIDLVDLSSLLMLDNLEISNCGDIDSFIIPETFIIRSFKASENKFTSLGFLPSALEIKSIVLDNNYNLNICNNSLLCYNISLDNSVIFKGNNGDCNKVDILITCGYEIPNCPTETYHINSQETYNNYVAEYSECTQIENDIIIDKQYIENSNFMDNVRVILGNLTVNGMNTLSEKLNLTNLIFISGDASITGGDYNSNYFEQPIIRGNLRLENLTSDTIDISKFKFSSNDLSVINCNDLEEIKLDKLVANKLNIENCNRLENVEIDVGYVYDLTFKNLHNFTSTNSFLSSISSLRTLSIDNVSGLDTFDMTNANCTTLSLLNNQNLSALSGYQTQKLSKFEIRNCDNILSIDLNSRLIDTPKEIEIAYNDGLQEISTPTLLYDYTRLENLSINFNPNLKKISIPQHVLRTEHLELIGNKGIKEFSFDESDELSIDNLEIIGNELLEKIDIPNNSSNNSNLEILENSSLKEIIIADSHINFIRFKDNEELQDVTIDNRNLNIDFVEMQNNGIIYLPQSYDTIVHITQCSIFRNKILDPYDFNFNNITISRLRFKWNNIKNLNISIQRIGGLYIENNYGIETIQISDDSEINYFSVYKNDNLNKISGMGSYPFKSVYFSDNANLSDITELNSAASTEKLKIQNNANLDECNVDFICNHLASDGETEIINNNANCNSQEIIESHCLVSVNPTNASEISLFPNPSSGLFTLQSSTPVLSVSIYNYIGDEILTKGSSTNIIDLTSHPNGIYFIKIKTHNNILQKCINKI